MIMEHPTIAIHQRKLSPSSLFLAAVHVDTYLRCVLFFIHVTKFIAFSFSLLYSTYNFLSEATLAQFNLKLNCCKILLHLIKQKSSFVDDEN